MPRSRISPSVAPTLPPSASIPTDPNVRMRRAALSGALNLAGFPVATATLATMATRGDGPPFQKFGTIPLYQWGTSLAWAEGRLTAPRASSSEADAPKSAAA